MPDSQPRVVAVGGGLAGRHAIRHLERRLRPDAAELVLVGPAGCLLDGPMPPEVATGALEPRHAPGIAHPRGAPMSASAAEDVHR